ncbi:MAG: hypothetical protein J1F05_03040 [Muribaculaceae bacterium]|nr:hypothetical protein [Muribaculaceae bacterium]
METRKYWLSYDLGVGGDYSSLYEWLDDHDAVPCGNSVAFFSYSTRKDDIDKALRDELTGKIDLNPGNKLYIIRFVGGNVKGSFIYGKRSGTPWEGYGTKNEDGDDE